MKRYHNQKIEKRKFTPGDLVFLFNPRLRLFTGKLKFKWTGPFTVTQVFPHRAVELENKEGMGFKDSSGEEYTPGKRRPPSTALVTTRCRNRQMVVSDEEHPSSTTPIVSPSLMRGPNMLRSRIPTYSHNLALVLASHPPPLPMPLAPERLMTRWAYLCTPFCLAPSQTSGVSMGNSSYIMMGRTEMSKRARPEPILRSVEYLYVDSTLCPLLRSYLRSTSAKLIAQATLVHCSSSGPSPEVGDPDGNSIVSHEALDVVICGRVRVLERPTPTIDVTTFQTELARLRADVDALLALIKSIPEPAPEVEKDEVVMSTLFGDPMPPPDTS
ncbi:hypothetical protein MTR67_035143 [Solanum verrucosum]|uniref:Integrase core domain containing protein n=1 Tax=Solanum verrucosum TaxID=315347 RepID=A0AAF0U9K3_SOLVR|nr:hypothetical protein MTR67_035143 [Solanum verrucosum]